MRTRNDAITERENARRDMINLLKERLQNGSIRTMEMKLLDDLLSQIAEAPPSPGEIPELLEDLPFEGENLVVGNFDNSKGGDESSADEDQNEK